MHAARPPKLPNVNRPPANPAATFICSGCGTVQHTHTPVLPEGWWAVEIAESIAVICEDCPAPDAQEFAQ